MARQVVDPTNAPDRLLEPLDQVTVSTCRRRAATEDSSLAGTGTATLADAIAVLCAQRRLVRMFCGHEYELVALTEAGTERGVVARCRLVK